MTVSLTGNFLTNARGITFKDSSGATWSINSNTNEISVAVGGGTVGSVGLSDGSTTPIYTISGSPVTGSGTLTLTLKTQSANLILAGPANGSAAQPGFRALVLADIPTSYPYSSLASAPSVLSGTFTGTLTGLSTTQTTTCTYYQIGNIVVIFLGTGFGTSNATSFTMTGLPTALQPTSNTYVAGGVSFKNNGADVLGCALITAQSGTVQFYPGVFASTWSSSGTKAMNNGVITYLLA